jgi:hypothetical protein
LIDHVHPEATPRMPELMGRTLRHKAAMVLTMFGIGVALVASLANCHVLVSIRRSLGGDLVSHADRAG